MTNHLLKKSFTSDRYYELRHNLESEFHNDYAFSNAIAYGEIGSVKVLDNKTLEIETANYCDDGASVLYRVQIHYLNNGEHGPKHNNDNDEFHGYWFDKFPKNGQKYLTFDNCVFDIDLKIKDLNGVSFQNCFFLRDVAIESKDSEIICFEQCYFDKNLNIHNLKTDSLFIRNCNIANSLSISNCTVNKWTSICHDYVKLGFHILESVFVGNECLFDNIKTGYGLEIYNCNFETTVEMSNCLIESLDVEESNFNNLNIDNVATKTYHTFEDLIADHSEEDIEEMSDESIIIMGDIDSIGNDPIIRRIKRFQTAMNEAFNKNSFIRFIQTNFNGLVSVSNIRATVITFGCCRAYDEVTIIEMDRGRYFDRDYGPIGAMILNQKKQEYNIQFLDLGCTIFYENAEIQNIYRFIDLSETKFKDNLDIDEEYLDVTKGWIVKRISKDIRLIDYNSRTLQELLGSCNRDDYEKREKLFLDVKTQERGDCKLPFKIGYIAHELLSNYGKSPLRILVVMTITIGLFSLLFFSASHGTIGDCILDSCSSFFTIGLGMSHLDDCVIKSLVVLEGAIGFSLMSYFIVVLCDRRK